jgi:hypothetical protein
MHINVVVIGHVDSGKSTTTGKPASTLNLCLEHPAHIHNRSLDLQVRRYRQAYHREVREGKNFTSLSPWHKFLPYRDFLPLGGVEIRFPQSSKFCARTFLARQRALVAAHHPFHSYIASMSLIQLLIHFTGSRRVGQGFLQVCVGS